MIRQSNIKYGFIKPSVDAHTLGINSAAELLRDCGYEVIFADDPVAKAIEGYRNETNRKIVVDWMNNNHINRLGISYRLDQTDAENMVGYILEEIKRSKLLKSQGGQIELVFFGGLPNACAKIEKEFMGLVKTFIGGETVRDTLLKMGVPDHRIPNDISEGCKYDDTLLRFGKDVIDSQHYLSYRPHKRPTYPEYGTDNDTLLKRLESRNREIDLKYGNYFEPLVRAHVGPYSSNLSRMESIREFLSWAKSLAQSGYLDILSIGSSQLTQSNFGEDWEDRVNGGGVPVNSPEEFRLIWNSSRPLLIRTYAGTKNIPYLAQMYEETINICWHALSLWWFNKLDERGPNDLYTNLKQHMDTMDFIAKTNKPFESNVSHHFAFRGADDVTYIVSVYLAAKLAKKRGIKTFILQNMLNTPRMTWGIQDLAKSRAMLKLVKELEDENFKVLLQPRAGLDYFKPDLYEARIQLAGVSALMDDIDPHNELSPPMIHVVSYSEASHLATPEIINESIQITQYSLKKYREMRKHGKIEDMSVNSEVSARSAELFASSKKIVSAIESCVNNTYSADGFYKIFAAGFLPVPYLWKETDEFRYAKNWKTKPIKGSVKVVDDNGRILATDHLIEIAINNLKSAEYNLNQIIKF